MGKAKPGKGPLEQEAEQENKPAATATGSSGGVELGSDELGRAQTLVELGSDELGRAQTLAAGPLVIKRLITDGSIMEPSVIIITDGSIMEPSVIWGISQTVPLLNRL